ncbi:hypothetical protein BJY52DRAFT_1416814 [Lactarius psammicola]|nr:hypothetical protein BJY52DRAFT_1416814 [Lactarius psammicola]
MEPSYPQRVMIGFQGHYIKPLCTWQDQGGAENTQFTTHPATLSLRETAPDSDHEHFVSTSISTESATQATGHSSPAPGWLGIPLRGGLEDDYRIPGATVEHLTACIALQLTVLNPKSVTWVARTVFTSRPPQNTTVKDSEQGFPKGLSVQALSHLSLELASMDMQSANAASYLPAADAKRMSSSLTSHVPVSHITRRVEGAGYPKRKRPDEDPRVRI